MDFALPEKHLSTVAIGQEVFATNSAYPGETFAGKIMSIDSRIDPVTRSINVRTLIDNADGRLRPGMLLKVVLQKEVLETLVIDEKALVPDEDRQFVFKVVDGKAVKTQVQLGVRRPGKVQILDGLVPGDEVVTQGTLRIRHGSSSMFWLRGLNHVAFGYGSKTSGLCIGSKLTLNCFGLVAISLLSLREYPDIDPPIVSVNTSYPGASAEIIETRITQLLEDRISGIEGIKNINSSSRNGRSSISIEFNLSRDIDAAANDVRERISRALGNLPDQAFPPEVSKAGGDGDVIVWYNLRSTNLSVMELTDYADRFIADRLSVVDGVARVRLGGGSSYAMKILLDRDAMAARGVTVSDVERIIRSENVELPADRSNQHIEILMCAWHVAF